MYLDISADRNNNDAITRRNFFLFWFIQVGNNIVYLSLEEDDGLFKLVSEDIISSGAVDVRVADSDNLDYEIIQTVHFQVLFKMLHLKG